MEKTIKRAKKLLLTLGIAPNLKGYEYSAIAISKLMNRSKGEKVSYCKLYDEVGLENYSTGARVERTIRHAMTYAFNHNTKQWEKLLNYKLDSGIKVSKFLMLCAEKLMMNEGF